MIAGPTCGFGGQTEGEDRCGLPVDGGPGNRSRYCVKHYRFFKMRDGAQSRGKAVPTHRQLEMLVPPDMKCVHCDCTMIWTTGEDGKRGAVASLQHYEDGTFGIICNACNTGHAGRMPILGEHERCPSGMKPCGKCLHILPVGAFHRSKSERDGRTSRCRSCVSKIASARKARRRAEREAARALLPPITERACAWCGQVKPLSEYHCNARSKLGVYSRCKECEQPRRALRHLKKNGRALPGALIEALHSRKAVNNDSDASLVPPKRPSRDEPA